LAGEKTASASPAKPRRYEEATVREATSCKICGNLLKLRKLSRLAATSQYATKNPLERLPKLNELDRRLRDFQLNLFLEVAHRGKRAIVHMEYRAHHDLHAILADFADMLYDIAPEVASTLKSMGRYDEARSVMELASVNPFV
jgi:hypothetical protein